MSSRLIHFLTILAVVQFASCMNKTFVWKNEKFSNYRIEFSPFSIAFIKKIGYQATSMYMLNQNINYDVNNQITSA